MRRNVFHLISFLRQIGGIKVLLLVFFMLSALSYTRSAETYPMFEDDHQAREYYEPKANSGDVKAQLEMGKLCEQKAYFKKALYWYERAAQQGCEEGKSRYESLANDWGITRLVKWILCLFGVNPTELNCVIFWLIISFLWPSSES